ncbi:MAG: response regulator [Myxococcales bacterium]|nr:response regulator [Myxococcales bacterium]
MRTRLLLLLALPFAVCVALSAVFVAVDRSTDAAYRRALAWSDHAAAVLTLKAQAEQVVAAVEDGSPATERAIGELQAARAHSLALAAGFSDEELAEEQALDAALGALEVAARDAAAHPAPGSDAAVANFYRDRVMTLLDQRVAEEHRGSAAAARHGRAVTRRMLAIGVAIAAALLAMGVVMSLRLVRHLTRSLRYLEAQATRLAGGDLEGAIALDSHDELGRLAQAFDHMAAELRGSMVHRSELQALVERRSAELIATEDQLRQTQKLDAIGRLAGGIAHDFNNLLAVIIASGELAAESLDDAHPARIELAEVQAAALRAAALTRQLLAFSRRQPRQPQPLSLNDVITNLQRMLLRIIGEDVALTAELAPGACMIDGDVGQLEQVLTNLVVNARDAMPDGGRVTIRTSDVELRGPAAARVGVAPGGYVELAVIDTGAGIPADIQARLFEPFFTTKPTGTGLGLATVFGIVTQNDGGVAVESTPGHGATFRVYLPRSARAPVDAAAPPPVRVQGSATVLVVEDEAQVRGAVVRRLGACGYRVREAASGADALALLAERHDEVQLVLTDLVMPGMTGTALAAELRRRWPVIRVAFMSGYPAHPGGGDPGRLPEGVVIHKPFDADTLATAVERALA